MKIGYEKPGLLQNFRFAAGPPFIFRSTGPRWYFSILPGRTAVIGQFHKTDIQVVETIQRPYPIAALLDFGFLELLCMRNALLFIKTIQITTYKPQSGVLREGVKPSFT